MIYNIVMVCFKEKFATASNSSSSIENEKFISQILPRIEYLPCNKIKKTNLKN